MGELLGGLAVQAGAAVLAALAGRVLVKAGQRFNVQIQEDQRKAFEAKVRQLVQAVEEEAHNRNKAGDGMSGEEKHQTVAAILADLEPNRSGEEIDLAIKAAVNEDRKERNVWAKIGGGLVKGLGAAVGK